jgi:hypothetical protein
MLESRECGHGNVEIDLPKTVKAGRRMMTQKSSVRTLFVAILLIEGVHLERSASGQAVGFQPIPAPLPSGTILDVVPSVSADRRYVRMSLGVSFNNIIGFTNISVPAAVGGGGVGMNGAIGGLGRVGGMGGAGGMHGMGSVGLGRPAVNEQAPGFVIAQPAGDPFQQASQAPRPAVRHEVPGPPANPTPAARARNRRSGTARAQAAGAPRSRQPGKNRKQTAIPAFPEGDGTPPDYRPGELPFDWSVPPQ